ncbi:hypothetical protein FQA39_LY04355 [Lamprigera yunnana]|nr:hypothetical protein FQA39_LY04355 [Lamprigera yunnana]
MLHREVDFHDTQNENKVLEITHGPKLLDISYNHVFAQDNANTVVSIAPSKPHDVETSTEANFRNEIEPQAVPDSYTTNVDDSPYVKEPFQDSGSSYVPSEEYGSDSTYDAMEKAPDEEQESSRAACYENVLTDEDSGDEDEGDLLDNPRQLTALAEVRFVGGEVGEDAVADRPRKEDLTWIDGDVMPRANVSPTNNYELSEATVHAVTILGAVNLYYFVWRFW